MSKYENPWKQDKDKVTVNSIFEDGHLTVDKMLEYPDVTLNGYIPSVDAIDFINFIRLVLGEEPENTSPMAHYFLIDCVFQHDNVKPYFDARNIDFHELKGRTIVLCTREFGKSVLIVYLMLYLAARGKMPNFGPVYYGLYVSDSMRNGVRNTMETIGKVYQESIYLQYIFEDVRLVQDEVNFVRKPTTKKEIAIYNEFVIKQKKDKKNVPGRMKRTFSLTGLGAAALPLDSILYTKNGTTTIGNVSIGQEIYGPDGELATVIEKSKIFNKPTYKINLNDGRSITVTDDHINSILVKNKWNPSTVHMNITTRELIEKQLFYKRNRSNRTTKEALLYIENIKAINYPTKKLPIDPYTLGLLLGDGSFKSNSMTILHGDSSDLQSIYNFIPYELGTKYYDKRNTVVSVNIKGLSEKVKNLKLDSITCKHKFVPNEYFYGDIDQRLGILQGLMDSDGSIYNNNRMKFTSISKQLADGITRLVRSLGGTAYQSTRQNPILKTSGDLRSLTYLVEISMDICPVRIPRKVNNFKVGRKQSTKVSITSIIEVESIPSQCIAIDNKLREYITTDFVRTHNTGGRGSRDGLARPQFAIFDDMIPSEAEASSDTILANIESTIEADVLKALSGNGNFAIGIGTPYNKKDPIYKRIEQKSWLPVVFPRAENPPIDGMKEKDFKSVWPDRHTFKQCRIDYTRAKRASDNGDEEPMRKLMQENYLKIANDGDRMVPDALLQWFNADAIVSRAWEYNWYMTTDYTTTGSKGSDYSGAALWAVGHDGSWFLMGLTLRKMELEEQYNNTFEMIENVLDKVRWVEVGVELDGGQGTHIYALEKKMLERNTHFSFAKQKGVENKNRKGIISRLVGGSKHWRFRSMLPMFQNRKIWFAEHLRASPDMRELLDEIKFTTYKSINSISDDGIDLISMINAIDYTLPSKEFSGNDGAPKKRIGMKSGGINALIWGKKQSEDKESTAYDSYNG